MAEITVFGFPQSSFVHITRLVLTHADLAERARATVPHAVVVEFQMFLGDPVFDQVENAIKEGDEIRG